VLVVGDLIVDEIVNCHPLGISSEETAVVATPIDTKRFIGGAGIVAAHCAALGTKVTLLSCRGDDEVGEWAENMLKDYAVETILGIDNSGLVLACVTVEYKFSSL
jgi:bifunctional ADP-heptose synthase (sugar kinase/adenylyltransferase)